MYKNIFFILLLLFSNQLLAQNRLKLWVEPYSGASWRRPYMPYVKFDPSDKTTSHSNVVYFAGLNVGLKYGRFGIGLDKRGQNVNIVLKKTEIQDTSSNYLKSFIFVNSIKAEYQFISNSKANWTVQLGYSIPAFTYWEFALRKWKQVYSNGQVVYFDDYYYLRSGAFYAGLKLELPFNKNEHLLCLSLGAERLRNDFNRSFGEWYFPVEKGLWYFMGGMHMRFMVKEFKKSRK